MKTFTNKKGISYLLLDVPEDAKQFKLVRFSMAGLWLKQTDSKKLNGFDKSLGKGNYELIGLAKDISESQAADIVDHRHSWSLYYCHEYLPYSRFETATSCLSSLVQSLGLNNPIILKKI